MKLILASNSRTRKEILNNVGLFYEIEPSNIEEISDKETQENMLWIYQSKKQKP